MHAAIDSSSSLSQAESPESTGDPRVAERPIASSDITARLLASIRDYAIYTLDRDGRVASWHPGAERLKGYSEGAILGRHFEIFYTQEARDAGEPERALEQAWPGGFDTEGWRVRQDGTQFWAGVLVTPLHDDRGQLVGFAKITRDLSERRRAEHRAILLARTEERLRVRDAFLDEVRRELEGALSALGVHLRSLTTATTSQGAESANASTHKLALLQWGVDRLGQSVERVLSVARAAADRLDRESDS